MTEPTIQLTQGVRGEPSKHNGERGLSMRRDTRFRLIILVGAVIMMAASVVLVQSNRAYQIYHTTLYQVVWLAIGVVLLLGVGTLILRMWLQRGFTNIRPQILVGQFVVLVFILYGLILAIHNLG